MDNSTFTLIDGGIMDISMEVGQKYWTFYVSPTGWKQVHHSTWHDDMIDNIRLKEGRVFDSETQAKTAAALVYKR